MRLEDIAFAPAQWTVVASATNGAATATKAAVARQRHFITGYTFSGSGTIAAAATFQVKDGATVVDQFELPATAAAAAAQHHDYVRPIRCAVNSAAAATVGALGVGIVGTVAIRGFSVTD